MIKNELFEEKVEDALVGPVFVYDYPSSICPLTKRKADDAAIAERFELFIQGMELANAYTELNDPDLQEQLFLTTARRPGGGGFDGKNGSRFYAKRLRHGMPPAGGLGVGIDRLVMLLTNTTTIRESYPLPAVAAGGIENCC